MVTSLSNLFQCLTTGTVIVYFLISDLNLLCLRLRPFPLVLLQAKQERLTPTSFQTDPTPSFQGVLEGDGITLQPPLLKTKQPQLPQLFLLRLVFWSFCDPCSLLWTHSTTSIKVRSPEVDTALDVQPCQCQCIR